MNLRCFFLILSLFYLNTYVFSKPNDKGSEKSEIKPNWLWPNDKEIALFKQVFANFIKGVALDNEYNWLIDSKIHRLAYQCDETQCLIIYEVNFIQNQVIVKKKYIYPRIIIWEDDTYMGDPTPPRLLDVLKTIPF